MNARVIAVADNKGGVGKTTTAGVLADGLAKMCLKHSEGENVLVVDLDPQGNQADIFGVRADVIEERLCVGNVLMARAIFTLCRIISFRLIGKRTDCPGRIYTCYLPAVTSKM